MATSSAPANASYTFDDRNIRWFELGDFKHFALAMLDIDRQKKLVDFIIKFDPNEMIFLHRHLVHTNTLVVQGEHRLYEPDGRLKEIRPVGSYTSSPPGEPHREGAGDQSCIVFYSLRADQDAMFEVLDDDQKVVGTLGMQDFIGALEDQKRARGA